jgi:DNA (cytosine-5)-methyltransferase 1
MEDGVRHGDAFAGIGGFALPAHRVGWETVWACEIERAARSVYAARFGTAHRFDLDIRESTNLPPIDILTGGFPCQDLSVAGGRAGLKGERSGLFFELVRILQESRPEWFVFENVPGLLSSHGGRDMATVLDSLVQCGYGVAYRILNAQFFGVAQRRRRVFLVGHSSGDERRAAQILFEPASSGGNPAKVRSAEGQLAFAVACHAAKGGDQTTDNYVVVTGTLQGGGQRGHRIDTEGARDGFLVAGTYEGKVRNLNANIGRTYDSAGRCGIGPINLVCSAPDASGVREATGLPRSLDVCEVCKKGPDAPRYRTLGNAVAVPVVEWIFRRINTN